MKIIAIIADDNAPEGRRETYPAKNYNVTQEEAQIRMGLMVERFNDMLRAGELPRRLLSVELVEHTPKEAEKMGREAFYADLSVDDNYWPEWHDLREAWRDGYKEAELAFVESCGVVW